MSPVIEVRKVSKKYRIGTLGFKSFLEDCKKVLRLQKRADAFEDIEENKLSEASNTNWVNALRDINLAIHAGERVGIIGKNGAGKSTLLKILSRITTPSLGDITMQGRVASLLEVGTGFHPDFTGRENVYMNGLLLGMTRAEIDRKIEEIVTFSGTEKYFDTPVKRYSSGMRVRLGFAVAAHLAPDILIVDEVLAVGDAEFQRKAIGKMKDVSNEQGRTVLFVSHNMQAIQRLCDRVIVLDKGKVYYDGAVKSGISQYLRLNQASTYGNQINRTFGGVKARIIEANILDEQNNKIQSIEAFQKCLFKIVIELKDCSKFLETVVNVYSEDNHIFTFEDLESQNIKGNKKVVYFDWKNILSPGDYYCVIKVKHLGGLLDRVVSLNFNVKKETIYTDRNLRSGLVQVDYSVLSD